MNTIVKPYEVADLATIEPTTSATMTTTLYDLIASIQAAVESDEDELVVPIVAYMLQTGRATFLRGASTPSYQDLAWA
ncbi:MAG: hypothetical protein ETSY1_06615 [Candidatus Entotheonella factor]|uniref:Uncharacterized protein n=1 Tax=Entotheonella factor TaxID=1429438 RepID=W4LUI2_ENTF1|nr:hypothetical protein [Candidatus Entotheonella palauensis]ETX01648.1 MAG: hypothetical protein ETSY1_06615 [Candidatus Entotheonella factor]